MKLSEFVRIDELPELVSRLKHIQGGLSSMPVVEATGPFALLLQQRISLEEYVKATQIERRLFLEAGDNPALDRTLWKEYEGLVGHEQAEYFRKTRNL